MTLKYSRNKCGLVYTVGGCLSRGKLRCGRCNAFDRRDISCPICTCGMTATVASNRYSANVLYYNANVNVSVTTGGMGKVETTIISGRFYTRVAHERGGTGVLYVNNEIADRRSTIGFTSVFLGAPCRNNERRGHISVVASVRGNAFGTWAGWGWSWGILFVGNIFLFGA